MKRYLLRFGLFLLLGSVMAGLSSGLIGVILAEKIAEAHPFKIDEKKKFLFVGDSHIECAINDSVFSEAVNLGAPSEAYLYSYIKAKAMLESNKGIKAVITGFSYHSFSAYTDPWISGDYYLPHRITKFFFALPAEEQKVLFKANPPGYIKGYLRLLLSSYYFIGEGYKTYRGLKWGAFYPMELNALQIQLQREPESYRTNGVNKPIQMAYIYKLKELCRSHNAELILLGTPVHKYRISRVTADTTNLYNIYRTNFSDIRFYDYSTLNLPDSCFGDLKHLNLNGSVVFSDILRERMLREFGEEKK